MPSGIYPKEKRRKFLSQSHRDKIGAANSISLKGKKQSQEVIDKRRKTMKRLWQTPEFRKKLCGKNSFLYIYGHSFEPYTIDWTETLRISIRERDHYTCQMPGCNKLQGDILHSVHHIDYDKKNCNPDNLVTLCRSCHIKTNRNRSFWMRYFWNLFKNF